MTDTGTSSVRIPKPHEVIEHMLKSSRRASKFLAVAGWVMVPLGVLGLAVVTTAAVRDMAGWLHLSLVAGFATLVIVGSGCWRSSAQMRNSMHYYLSIKWEMDEARHEIRDARPADAVELARIAAELEALRAALPEALRAAHAKGYVLGVGERLNGQTAGTVVPFQKP